MNKMLWTTLKGRRLCIQLLSGQLYRELTACYRVAGARDALSSSHCARGVGDINIYMMVNTSIGNNTNTNASTNTNRRPTTHTYR